MKIMTDRQADALRDQGKIVIRTSDSGIKWFAFSYPVSGFVAAILALYLDDHIPWQEYAGLVLMLIVSIGICVFLLIDNKRRYVMLDHKGITRQTSRNFQRLYWGEVKFVGSYSSRHGAGTVVSALPLPEGEECVGENRRISDDAYLKLTYSRTIVIPETNFNDNWTPIVIEMWEKYRDTAEATVGDYRFFPRNPRQ